MQVKTPVILRSMVLLLASTWGCSSSPTTAGNTNAPKPGGPMAPGPTADPGNDTGTQGDAPKTADGSTAGGSVVTPVTAEPKTETHDANGPTTTNANGWCTAAAQTSVVKAQGMAKLFAQLCNSGKATTLLTETLVNNAYSGTGSPYMHMIDPIGDSAGTVTAFFGDGMSLPFTSKTEFDTGALSQGSVANAIQLVKNQGDTPGPITSVPLVSNPDKGWVRGWTIETISTKSILFIFNIKTDYVSQIDQYDLGGGYYMYTAQLKKSVETMKEYQLLTAGFDIDGVGYLLTVALITVDDHGQPSIATRTVKDMAETTIKFMYTTATAK